jgi:3-phosphoshikimate 1-carboxyvinyltransferase
MTFQRPAWLRGDVHVPGDKSISHRALILAALAAGPSRIAHLGTGADVRATARCLLQLGVSVRIDGDVADVLGQPLKGWRAPDTALDCGNSGTTLRLLLGVIAAADGVRATLTGDASLLRRPVRRVLGPLTAMGAEVACTAAGTPPAHVTGRPLHGTRHDLAIASAQLKSSVLLAGLHADGATSISEPAPSRDHTERMLAALGVAVQRDGATVTLHPGPLRPLGAFAVPGDPSSAAFLVAAAVLHREAAVRVPSVALNPLRTGFVAVLRRMGAAVQIDVEGSGDGEPVGTVTARSSPLHGARIAADEVPACIDELPVLALCAACADGTSVFEGIGELRVKESDRLDATTRLLRGLGATVRSDGDRIEIDGVGSSAQLQAMRAPFAVGLDHRMAMTAAVAGIVGPAPVTVPDFDAADSSFPGFVAVLQKLSGR